MSMNTKNQKAMTSIEYDKTIEKLNGIIEILNKAIIFSDFESADGEVAKLRSYKECFYCLKYRKSLEDRGWEGCCEGCPCHKLGENTIGRKRAYNGCYSMGSYRDMVKSAFKYNENKSPITAQFLVDSIQRTIECMQNHKEEM